MKFLHLADFHLGKRLKEFSMLEDQEYILNQIVEITKANSPDAVIIAGDVYDKSLPSEEAVNLFDAFLNDLTQHTDHLFVLCGNHDSAERLAFGRTFFQRQKIHFSAVFDGPPTPISIEDPWGKVHIHLLPFIKPMIVRPFYEAENIDTTQEAMGIVIQSMNIDPEERNILVAHQFLNNGIRSESEQISVGGTDAITPDLFHVFDYTALGHLHCPQSIQRNTIRYAGSPLKYSLSEISHKKSVVLVDLKEKGNIEIQKIPLVPLREVRVIQGPFADVMKGNCAEGEKRDDYVMIYLTDEEEEPNALQKLRTVYQNILNMKYKNSRSTPSSLLEPLKDVERLSPLTAFEKLYKTQNNQEMTEEQKKFLTELLKELEDVQ